jgi:hypothetical protein
MDLTRGLFRLWVVSLIVWVPLALYVLGVPKVPHDRLWPLDTSFCSDEPLWPNVPRLPAEQCKRTFADLVYADWMHFGEQLGAITLPPIVLVLLIGATYWVRSGFRPN